MSILLSGSVRGWFVLTVRWLRRAVLLPACRFAVHSQLWQLCFSPRFGRDVLVGRQRLKEDRRTSMRALLRAFLRPRKSEKGKGMLILGHSTNHSPSCRQQSENSLWKRALNYHYYTWWLKWIPTHSLWYSYSPNLVYFYILAIQWDRIFCFDFFHGS